MFKALCSALFVVFIVNKCCSEVIIGKPCTDGQTGAVGTCASIRKPGDISAEKCKEYSSYGREAESTKYVCEHKIKKRIVGGERVTRKEFPHMVALGFEFSSSGEIIWPCGGSLISEQYILTGATCLNHLEKGDLKWVKLGVTALNDTNNQQQIKIAERISHPEYKTTAYYHDIALLKLATPVKFDHFVRPACLYLKSDISAQEAIATGWGRTGHIGGSPSNDLFKVTLDLYDHEYCDAYYKNLSRSLQYGIDNDTQICAGSESEKDTCQGDSGGPLQIHHTGDDVKCMYDIIGITSFGKGCTGSAAVYTRVSHYLKWIEDIVWP